MKGITTDRDEGLQSIRPKLEIPFTEAGEVEHFQNVTLRPILKFQNGIILAQFKKYLLKFKPTFNAYNQHVQRNFIEEVLKNDPRIKNSLIASVVSVMTIREYDTYCNHKLDTNKRIVGLLIKRLQDQLDLLY